MRFTSSRCGSDRRSSAAPDDEICCDQDGRPARLAGATSGARGDHRCVLRHQYDHQQSLMQRQVRAPQLVASSFSLDRFLGHNRPRGGPATRLSDDPRCYWRPLHTRTPTQAARFYGRIIGLLGKLPILGRLVPQIVRPIHAAQSNGLGPDGDRMVKPVRVCRVRQNNRLARKCDDFRDWHV